MEIWFNEFWKVYPKKRAKFLAERAWMKLRLTDEVFEEIIGAVQKFKLWDEWRRDGGMYIPLPATFLNQRRWEDEIDIDLQEETISEAAKRKREESSKDDDV